MHSPGGMGRVFLRMMDLSKGLTYNYLKAAKERKCFKDVVMENSGCGVVTELMPCIQAALG